MSHKEQMERLVREELELWDCDASTATSSARRTRRPSSGLPSTSL